MSQLQDGSIISEFISNKIKNNNIKEFISNEKLFKASIENRFVSLDTDNDGFISFAEMGKELISLRILKPSLDVDVIALSHAELKELRRDIFARFDRDGRRMVHLEEFQEEMREMLIQVANSLSLSKAGEPNAKL